LTSAISWIGPGPARAGPEVATGGRLGRLVLHLGQRHPPPRGGHLVPLGGDDLVEDGGHGLGLNAWRDGPL
jgi:hypothetical protein